MFFPAILRGVRKRCPRCGVGKLFERRYTLRQRCSECDLQYERRDGDTWAFMYVSTALITGPIVTLMLMIRPPSMLIGRIFIFAVAAAALLASLPNRKGIAVALEYLIRRKT